MQHLTLGLDWTPNVNHIGFFVARDLGYYGEHGLEVEILDPSADNYATTPAKRVELGTADFALCPTESIISYRTKSTPADLVAIAGLLRQDVSALVIKADSGIASPRDLDGKTYGTYQARYEDAIVQQMVVNDGGRGDILPRRPDKLAMWNAFRAGDIDATWVFLNWEGVQQETSEVAVRYFKMHDYDVPYSYSPVIAVRRDRMAEQREAYRDFLAATRRGYLYCQAQPEEAVSILSKYVAERDRDIDLSRALELTAPHFGTPETWGRLEPEVLQPFLDWLHERELESADLTMEELATNELL